MIYKSSRVFNFAAGEFATLGAFGTYIGITVLDLPYLLAALLGVAAGTIAGLLTERLVVRPLSNRPKVTVLVATAAIATIAIPLELMIGGVKTFPARPAFQNGVSIGGVKIISKLGPSIFGVRVSAQLLLIMVALIAIGVLLVWFFGRTDLGLATLATSQEPTAGRLVGIRLNRAPVRAQRGALPPQSCGLGGAGGVRPGLGPSRCRVRPGQQAVPGRRALGRCHPRHRRPEPERPCRLHRPDLPGPAGVRRH